METPKNAERSWVRQRCIGRGSFATVSLAVSKEDGRVFAVKSVGGAGATASRMESLEDEIRILRALSSPYVLRYLGDDETWEPAPVRNLHLEYLPGGTVADVAKRGGDEALVRSHARCVAEALRYVHALGIVHCDVKGQNVLVVGHSSSGLAKLADFGSAVETGSDRTGKISPRGSPLWMAPEVVRGEYQGPESDVWSLGCTVIEMLTGKPPWEDRGAADTLRRIGYSDELPRIPGELSESGRDFLGKCLQRDFKKRWSCDRLLRHPFLSVVPQLPESPAFFSSPRRVLDWVDSDTDSESNSASGTVNFSAKERIGRLASGAKGSDWETDGWVAVRREGEGAISEFQNLIRTEGQISPEKSDSVGIEEERTGGSEERSSSGIDGDGSIQGGEGPSTPWVSPVLRPVAGGGGDDNRLSQIPFY
ncbi:hypothetical protein DM860_012470 [Cuscuta australis]|uniref:Protein kinase domain-containing protein n=1 Tax=Cuscuta australis TaxID=267555 RepID=A0A328DGF7_9ASTE|nr:hypothetical protein DM860_012470 [Cuscuta australis]